MPLCLFSLKDGEAPQDCSLMGTHDHLLQFSQ